MKRLSGRAVSNWILLKKTLLTSKCTKRPIQHNLYKLLNMFICLLTPLILVLFSQLLILHWCVFKIDPLLCNQPGQHLISTDVITLKEAIICWTSWSHSLPRSHWFIYSIYVPVNLFAPSWLLEKHQCLFLTGRTHSSFSALNSAACFASIKVCLIYALHQLSASCVPSVNI